jgi:hypothetical protein
LVRQLLSSYRAGGSSLLRLESGRRFSSFVLLRASSLSPHRVFVFSQRPTSSSIHSACFTSHLHADTS